MAKGADWCEGAGVLHRPLGCPMCTGGRNKLYGASTGEGGYQLRSTSKKQGGNGVDRAGQHGLHFALFGSGVSGGEGVDGKGGGCRGPASSRFSFCGKSEGTYKVAPSLPENDTD